MAMNSEQMDLGSLCARVAEQFDKAIAAGDAFFYESEVQVSKVEGLEKAKAAESVPWQIRNVPALLKKPMSMSDKPKQAEEPPKEQKPQQQNPKDVFAPPYVPNLVIRELSDYTFLLNKFCVLPRHFLLVTREFQSQEMPPTPGMMTLVYQALRAHQPQSGRKSELMAFYNCGRISGASQPHCHFQMVELEQAPGTTTSVPIETLLDRIVRDGKEHEHIHMLPTPWQHFVALLQPQSMDPDTLERYLASRFTQLLDALFREIHLAVDQGVLSPEDAPQSRPSFNLLLTKNAMHLIPRRADAYDMRNAQWSPFVPGNDTPEGTGSVSVNALGYAGLMLTRHLCELEALKDGTNERIVQVLRHTGLPVVSGTVEEP